MSTELQQLVVDLVGNALQDERNLAPLVAFARLALIYQNSRRCPHSHRVELAEALRDLADKIEHRRQAVRID